MTAFQPFEMERMMSKYEQLLDFDCWVLQVVALPNIDILNLF